MLKKFKPKRPSSNTQESKKDFDTDKGLTKTLFETSISENEVLNSHLDNTIIQKNVSSFIDKKIQETESQLENLVSSSNLEIDEIQINSKSQLEGNVQILSKVQSNSHNLISVDDKIESKDEETDIASTNIKIESSSKVYRKNRNMLLHPESLSIDVDPFELPLRNLVTQIPSGNPLIKREVKLEKRYLPSMHLKNLDQHEDNDQDNVTTPKLCVDADGNLILDDKR